MTFNSEDVEHYAFPGGYAVVYEHLGEVYCPDCACTLLYEDWDDGPMQEFVHWEGPSLDCDGCNADLPSEYGEAH